MCFFFYTHEMFVTSNTKAMARTDPDDAVLEDFTTMPPPRPSALHLCFLKIILIVIFEESTGTVTVASNPGLAR